MIADGVRAESPNDPGVPAHAYQNCLLTGDTLLLYVAEINRRLSEPDTSLEDAVVAGATSQIRPMFMLIIVAMLGMMPPHSRPASVPISSDRWRR